MKHKRSKHSEIKRKLALICSTLGARMTIYNVHHGVDDFEAIAADVYRFIQETKNRGADVGCVMCPDCDEVVFAFEIVEQQKTAQI